MLGCRSVKVRTINFDAFESVNVPPVARVTSDGLVFSDQNVPKNTKDMKDTTLNTSINPHVSLVKLFPGFDPNLLFAMVGSVWFRRDELHPQKYGSCNWKVD